MLRNKHQTACRCCKQTFGQQPNVYCNCKQSFNYWLDNTLTYRQAPHTNKMTRLIPRRIICVPQIQHQIVDGKKSSSLSIYRPIKWLILLSAYLAMTLMQFQFVRSTLPAQSRFTAHPIPNIIVSNQPSSILTTTKLPMSEEKFVTQLESSLINSQKGNLLPIQIRTLKDDKDVDILRINSLKNSTTNTLEPLLKQGNNFYDFDKVSASPSRNLASTTTTNTNKSHQYKNCLSADKQMVRNCLVVQNNTLNAKHDGFKQQYTNLDSQSNTFDQDNSLGSLKLSDNLSKTTALIVLQKTKPSCLDDELHKNLAPSDQKALLSNDLDASSSMEESMVAASSKKKKKKMKKVKKKKKSWKKKKMKKKKKYEEKKKKGMKKKKASGMKKKKKFGMEKKSHKKAGKFKKKKWGEKKKKKKGIKKGEKGHKFLKDKGFKKSGFKKVHHKEEYGKKKKWHDIKRKKKWSSKKKKWKKKWKEVKGKKYKGKHEKKYKKQKKHGKKYKKEKKEKFKKEKKEKFKKGHKKKMEKMSKKKASGMKKMKKMKKKKSG